MIGEPASTAGVSRAAIRGCTGLAMQTRSPKAAVTRATNAILYELFVPDTRETADYVRTRSVDESIDVMLARRKMRSRELAERIGITEQNVSLLKSGKVKGIRFETLAKICEVLDCQPGDLLEAVEA